MRHSCTKSPITKPERFPSCFCCGRASSKWIPTSRSTGRWGRSQSCFCITTRKTSNCVLVTLDQDIQTPPFLHVWDTRGAGSHKPSCQGAVCALWPYQQHCSAPWLHLRQRAEPRHKPTLEDTLSLVPGPHSYSAAHFHKWELEITSRRLTRTAKKLFTLSCVTPWLTEHKPWIFCKQCQHSSAIVRRVIRALQFDLPLNAHMLPPAEFPIPCRNSHESRHTGSSREPGAQQQTQLVLADHGAGWNGLEGSAKELTSAK